MLNGVDNIQDRGGSRAHGRRRGQQSPAAHGLLHRRRGEGKAFYAHTNTWFGGSAEVLEMGRLPYRMRMGHGDPFFLTSGKVPGFGTNLAELTRSACFDSCKDPIRPRML